MTKTTKKLGLTLRSFREAQLVALDNIDYLYSCAITDKVSKDKYSLRLELGKLYNEIHSMTTIGDKHTVGDSIQYILNIITLYNAIYNILTGKKDEKFKLQGKYAKLYTLSQLRNKLIHPITSKLQEDVNITEYMIRVQDIEVWNKIPKKDVEMTYTIQEINESGMKIRLKYSDKNETINIDIYSLIKDVSNELESLQWSIVYELRNHIKMHSEYNLNLSHFDEFQNIRNDMNSGINSYIQNLRSTVNSIKAYGIEYDESDIDVFSVSSICKIPDFIETTMRSSGLDTALFLVEAVNVVYIVVRDYINHTKGEEEHILRLIQDRDLLKHTNEYNDMVLHEETDPIRYMVRIMDDRSHRVDIDKISEIIEKLEYKLKYASDKEDSKSISKRIDRLIEEYIRIRRSIEKHNNNLISLSAEVASILGEDILNTD